MGGRLKKGLLLFLYGIGCGLMLCLFTIIKGMANLVFSLLAVVIAIHYFKNFASIRSRIAFIALAIVSFLVFVFIYAVITAMRSGAPGAA